jgi:endonuclease III
MILKDKIKKINQHLVRHFGIPSRPKKLPNPIDTVIATILSQNTNDSNSYKAYQNLKQKYDSWEEVAEIPTNKIEKIIRVAGLGKQKSETIKKLLTSLQKNHKNVNLQYVRKMSDEDILKELTSIKGIGVKTASCVLLFSLNRNVCPVDTHVHRTLNRIGLVKTKTPDKTFELINKSIPAGIAHQFHTNLIKLGREICKPGKPLCSVCPLKTDCRFKNKNFEAIKTNTKNNFLLLDSI